MITISQDPDMFNVGAQMYLNPVNCIGVAGKGLALKFREECEPGMLTFYQSLCSQGFLKIGTVWEWHGKRRNGTHIQILFFPTKQHWRDPSRYEYIETGLQALYAMLKDKPPIKIAIPALGCGLGNLEWSKVSESIQNVLSPLNHHFVLFPPQ